MKGIRTALLSVHDKTGLVDFAKRLSERGVRLLSTGGTAKALEDAGLEVTSIADVTGQEEMLGGRVKTLHPRIFAGILARRECDDQQRELEEAGIAPIDLVVVNLYPFEATVAQAGHTVRQALEQIDIGGVSLLRAAVKNFPDVIPVVEPSDYPRLLEETGAGIAANLRPRLEWAQKAIAHTARYEATISNYLNRLQGEALELEGGPNPEAFPRVLSLGYRRLQTLRYGENPHQSAGFYISDHGQFGVPGGEQLQGKELSFNNILDLDSAWRLSRALGSPGATVMKHGNPCGAAEADSLPEAYRLARATDPMSAFGGVVGLNARVDEATAEEITDTFVEAVVAPEFSPEALKAFQKKPNLRVLWVRDPGPELDAVPEYRWVLGGLLVQDRDLGTVGEWRCVTERAPSTAEDRALRFAWKVVQHVRSNAISVARGRQLIGVGAGQMSRVDACRFATWKANDAGHELHGSAAASDAFFPFPDGVQALAEAGVTAVVQPGGSVRDQEVIDAANELGLAMIFTGARHFRH